MLKMGDGFRLEDIQGRHHSIFVDPTYAQSKPCRKIWPRLGRGERITLESKRIGAHGEVVSIQADYDPIINSRGRVVKSSIS